MQLQHAKQRHRHNSQHQQCADRQRHQSLERLLALKLAVKLFHQPQIGLLFARMILLILTHRALSF